MEGREDGEEGRAEETVVGVSSQEQPTKGAVEVHMETLSLREASERWDSAAAADEEVDYLCGVYHGLVKAARMGSATTILSLLSLLVNDALTHEASIPKQKDYSEGKDVEFFDEDVFLQDVLKKAGFVRKEEGSWVHLVCRSSMSDAHKAACVRKAIALFSHIRDVRPTQQVARRKLALFQVLELNKMNCGDEDGNTALHHAAATNAPQTIKLLLNRTYAKANSKNTAGATPLHKAVQNNALEALYTLLYFKHPIDQEVDPNAKDKNGDTPLHHAVLVGNVDVVNALLYYSTADTRMRNDDHLTALQLAGQRGNVEVVDLIVQKESGLVRAPVIPSYVFDTPKGYDTFTPMGTGMGQLNIPSLRRLCIGVVLDNRIPYNCNGLSESLEEEIDCARVMVGYPEFVGDAIPTKDCSIKLVLLGADFVGKSCLCSAWHDGIFAETHPTIGACFSQRVVYMDHKRIHLQVWDTAGQDRFDSLAPMYYRGANAVVALYDPFSRRSWDKAKFWIQEVQDKGSESIDIYLASTKMDIYPLSLVDVAVPFSEVEAFMQEKDIKGWLPVSARNQVNVNRLFVSVLRGIMEKQSQHELSSGDVDIHLPEVPSSGSVQGEEEFFCQPWVPDSASESCTLCHSKFTIIFRRHHCRRCGRLCCSNCSKRKAKIPGNAKYESEPTRVCCKCFPVLARHPLNKG